MMSIIHERFLYTVIFSPDGNYG